jgi:two-component system, NarL family, response regulator
MQPAAEIRVLIVDDHLVVRMGLRSMIQSEAGMTVVGEASNGHEALEKYRAGNVNLVLMDLRMPRVGGVEATAAIRKHDPQARILVLTTYDGDENIYRALQAGALGYLLKDMPREDFVAAVQKVAQGEYYIPQQVAARLAQRLPAQDLSHREMDVLKLIVQGRSNKEIADRLGLSESTIKNHVNGLLAKLHVQDRTQAVTTALKRGIVTLD